MREAHRIASSGGVAAIAAAHPTPSSTESTQPITSEILSHSTFDGRDYVLRRIVLEPGGTTGWHFHAGMLYCVVTQGTLTHYRSDGTVDGVYNEEDILVEPKGRSNVHCARNHGPLPMVLVALYVNPVGSRLSEDAPSPYCLN